MKEYNFNFRHRFTYNSLEEFSKPNEIWKLCSIYDEYVSNFGRICKKKFGKFIISKLSKSSNGYLHVFVNRKFIDVHRLVAMNFVKNPNNKKYVNHKDENKYNNYYENLEWCDNKYNNSYGSRKKNKILQIDPITNKIIATYNDAIDAAIAVKGHNTSILKCCKRKPKHLTAKGYIWRYEFDCEFN